MDHPSINQSVNQSINQSIKQASNQSSKQSINQASNSKWSGGLRANSYYPYTSDHLYNHSIAHPRTYHQKCRKTYTALRLNSSISWWLKKQPSTTVTWRTWKIPQLVKVSGSSMVYDNPRVTLGSPLIWPWTSRVKGSLFQLPTSSNRQEIVRIPTIKTSFLHMRIESKQNRRVNHWYKLVLLGGKEVWRMVREKNNMCCFFLGSRLSQEKGDCYERFSPRKNIHKAISQTTKLPWKLKSWNFANHFTKEHCFKKNREIFTKSANNNDSQLSNQEKEERHTRKYHKTITTK